MGWLVKGKGAAADVFVPFAFEVGGALGSEAEAFLRECTAVAEWKNQGGWRFSPLVLYDLGGTLATADRRGDRPGCSKVRRACCNGWLGEQWHGPRLLTRVRP